MQALSELGKILKMVVSIASHPGEYDAEELAASLDVSRATAYRYVKEAQHLGVDLVLVVMGRRGRGYEVRNWSSVQARTLVWLDLEQRRTLLGSPLGW